MEAATLPYSHNKYEIPIDQPLNENEIRKRIRTENGHLVSSIRFAALPDKPLAPWVLTLNAKEQVTQMEDPEKKKKTLELHGVPISKDKKYLREYILFIFQARTLLMYATKQTAWIYPGNQKKSIPYKRIPLEKAGKEIKRVQTMAFRAVYSLGLDYGVVRIQIKPGKKTTVVSVNPSPKLHDDMEDVFVQAICHYINRLKNDTVQMDQIVLGADPEFVMQSLKGHLLVASNYFPVKGRVGCDAIWLGQNHSNKPLVEIRPEPTSDPRELVIRIYRGLQQAAKKMRDIPCFFLAGALPYEGFPLGGHIHFSGIQPDFKMLRALDTYLAFVMMVAEDNNGSLRRPTYGFLGDFRFQPHGGFEYRTLPSWLISPTLTKGVFSLGKVIVKNYHLLQYDLSSDLPLQEAYYSGDKEAIREWIHILQEDIMRLEDAQLYKKYIDRFFQYVTSGITWDEKKDFRENWRIYPYSLKKEESDDT